MSDWVERGREIAEYINQVEAENARLKELNRGMAFVLSLILPMAKGYADKNKVGNNANMIRRAEEILIQAERMGEGE